jgi:hypothetical protein
MIRRKLVRAVVGGLLLTASSFAEAQAPLHPYSDLDSIELILAEKRYQIRAPSKAQVSRANKPGCAKIWHPPAVRSMTFLELCSTFTATSETYARQATLSNGARVRFNINHDIGAGSGGTEGELKGQLEFDGKVFVLTCRDQGENGNNPEWCLHYLRYLEVKNRD